MLGPKLEDLLLSIIREIVLVLERVTALHVDTFQGFLVLPEESLKQVLALSLEDVLGLLAILLQRDVRLFQLLRQLFDRFKLLSNLLGALFRFLVAEVEVF